MAKPMQGSGLLLGRVFGIPIYLHTSWFVIFDVDYSVAAGPSSSPSIPVGAPRNTWTLGVVTSVLFFASVVFS